MKRALIYFLLFVPPLIFFTDLTRNPYYFQITLVNAGVPLLWIIFIFECLKKKEIKIHYGKIDIPLLSFFTIAFISIAVSYFSEHNYPIKEIIQEGKKIINIDYLRSSILSEGLKKMIFTVSNVILVYYLVLFFIRREDIKKTYHIIFLVGLVASIYGILQYFGIECIWPKVLNPYGGRCVSTFGNPNFISSYLVLLFPIVLSFMITEKENIWKKISPIAISLAAILVAMMFIMGERTPNLFAFLIFFVLIIYLFSYISKFSPHLTYLLIILSYFLCLLCTLTRSSWLGIITSFVFFGIVAYKHAKNFLLKQKKLLLLSAAAMILLFLIFPRSKVPGYHPTAIERITEIKEIKEKPYQPVHQRILIWASGWDMIREKPILGKGWGCFELFYPFYQGKYLFSESLRNFRTHANNAHNELIEVWSQTGTIGMGVYIWFLICLFTIFLRSLKDLAGEVKIFTIAILASIAGMLVDNALNVSLHFCIPAFLYWWNIAMLTKLTGESTFKLKNNKIYYFVIIPILVSIILISYKKFLGEMNYFKGFKFSKRELLNNAQPYLEKAEKYHLEVNNNYELGNVYARKKMRNKAIWAYYRALAANCGYDEIHFNLASVYLQKGDIENSIRNFSQSLYINPLSKEAYLALSNIFLRNYEKYSQHSEILLKQALRFYPQEKDFWNNLGYLFTRAGKIQDAVNAYRKALAIDPNFSQARKNLNNILMKAGRKEELIKYESLLRKSKELIKQKNWEGLIQTCKEMLKIFHNDFTANFYLANAYFMCGKFEEAIQAYKIAKSFNKDVKVLTNLAKAYLQLKEYELAKAELKEILKIDPTNEFARKNLDSIK